MSETNMDRARRAVDKMVREQGIGKSLTGYDANGEPEGIIDDHNNFRGISAGTHIILKDIADLLTKHFPGFRWAVQPSEIGGVFNIFNLDFHAKWGYVIRYADIVNDPKRKEVVKAGHTILQRFNYPGTVLRPSLMAMVKRNTKGEAIPNLSGLKKTRQTDQATVDLAIAEGKATHILGPNGEKIIEVRR